MSDVEQKKKLKEESGLDILVVGWFLLFLIFVASHGFTVLDEPDDNEREKWEITKLAGLRFEI